MFLGRFIPAKIEKKKKSLFFSWRRSECSGVGSTGRFFFLEIFVCLSSVAA